MGWQQIDKGPDPDKGDTGQTQDWGELKDEIAVHLMALQDKLDFYDIGLPLERTPPAPTGCLKCPTEGVGEDLYPLWKLALEPAEAFAYDTVKSQKGLTKTSSGMMLSVGAVDGFLMGELKLNEDELSDGYAALDLKL